MNKSFNMPTMSELTVGMENTWMVIDGQRIRVLVVEDDNLVAQTISGLLTEHGCEVVGLAMNGREAVTMTQTLRPDVVVMDIRMPDIDGITASQLIQETCPTPVIALTAYGDKELVESAAQAGVAAYLMKPIAMRELERAIIIARARFADMMTLRKLNKRLAALNADLDLFAQMVAHDLRHLLSPVQGYAEILQLEYDDISPDEARESLGIISQAVHDMDNLIGDLLLLANVRQQDVPRSSLEMEMLTQETLRRLRFLIERHHAQIAMPDVWPVVCGYGPWVVQVWVNYISNAIKYGGPSPHIELGWEELPTYIMNPTRRGIARFWVKDYGVGIASQDLPYVFDAFTRVGDIKSHRHGLGLSIVKHIVEQLEGEVSVASTKGLGSTFSFTLPLASPDEDAA